MFLTPEERSYLVWRKSACSDPLLQVMLTVGAEYDNSSVGEEEHFEMRHLWAAFTDWQIYMHILVYMSIIGPRACFRVFRDVMLKLLPVYGISLFLPYVLCFLQRVHL